MRHRSNTTTTTQRIVGARTALYQSIVWSFRIVYSHLSHLCVCGTAGGTPAQSHTLSLHMAALCSNDRKAHRDDPTVRRSVFHAAFRFRVWAKSCFVWLIAFIGIWCFRSGVYLFYLLIFKVFSRSFDFLFVVVDGSYVALGYESIWFSMAPCNGIPSFLFDFQPNHRSRLHPSMEVKAFMGYGYGRMCEFCEENEF